MTLKTFRFIFKERTQKKADLIGKKCSIFLNKIGSPAKLWTKDIYIDASFWNGKLIEVAVENGHNLVFDAATKSMVIIKADFLMSQSTGSNVDIEV